MNKEPGVVPATAVRPLTIEQALGLDLPHLVALRVGGTWRQAWLLGHDRDAEAVSLLVQTLEAGAGSEATWVSDVELGELDPRYGAATG